MNFMIVGLLALYFILFGGGHETFLLDPNFEKAVSIYVKDKDRKSEIDEIVKQTEKSEEAFQKQTKKVYDKKLVDLNMNFASKPIDFKQEYDSFYIGLTELVNGLLTSELKVRSLIHPSEWDSIINKAIRQPDETKVRKAILSQNQHLQDRLIVTCNKYVTDSLGKAKVRIILGDYEIKGDNVVEAFLELNFKYLNALRPYKVTRQDFEPIRTKMIGLRENYTNYLVEMRFKLKVLTPEKNWKNLAKELNSSFTYFGPGVSN
jgi:hypothetical protein